MKPYKKEIQNAETLDMLLKRRGKPEIHIHSAVTLVWGGDPHAISARDRNEFQKELKQFAAVFKPEMIGKLQKSHVTQVFTEKEYHHTNLLRQLGFLNPGE